jgi:hypothetical protein
MKLFILFNSTISMSIVAAHAEKIISKLVYQNTHTPSQAISGWMNFHRFVSLASAGNNKFAMANIFKELTNLSNGSYIVESSNDENTEEYVAIGILLPSIVYDIAPKLFQDNDHSFILKHGETTSSIERMVGGRTAETASFPVNDVKLVQLLQKYFTCKNKSL